MQGAGAISETILVWKPFFRTLLDRSAEVSGKAQPRARAAAIAARKLYQGETVACDRIAVHAKAAARRRSIASSNCW